MQGVGGRSMSMTVSKNVRHVSFESGCIQSVDWTGGLTVLTLWSLYNVSLSRSYNVSFLRPLNLFCFRPISWLHQMISVTRAERAKKTRERDRARRASETAENSDWQRPGEQLKQRQACLQRRCDGLAAE